MKKIITVRHIPAQRNKARYIKYISSKFVSALERANAK